MSIVWSVLIVAAATGVAVGAVLLVRRRAPEGSVFVDGDRAAGVFGVLATGFSVLLGLIVFLAFTSYDQSRSGAETEALSARCSSTRRRSSCPPRSACGLGDELVCYGRAVVEQEWPRMRAGTEGDRLNPWGVALFRTLKTADPRTGPEQSAYDTWVDRTGQRELARNDRIHGAAGVIPGSLWTVLFFIAAAILAFMLFFADPGERWFAQAMLVGSVVAVITATMLLIHRLDNPVREHGGLQPAAMQRTLRILERERRPGGRCRPAAVRRQRRRLTRGSAGLERMPRPGTRLSRGAAGRRGRRARR